MFSNILISDHQFGFHLGHSTLDMLLLLSQQWLETLSLNQEVRTVPMDIAQTFDIVWHPALLVNLYYLPVACNATFIPGFLTSSTLPMRAGVPPSQYVGPSLVAHLY